ncbi:hypothetical protein DFR86_10395 [Acidianus sulfidivorans JP7]|uniref:Uncharacterized protein n=1 Tax=Acidianus sulfidivorans JP7 TaxID=619593 RepID=A0A2U9IPG7_9CREN|nr:hypothetical protein [Acidianus sulfidivorans]AWR97905.1 hypothetical protein DFR86_10395 [Acidianus sulfidivorans JP7]
MHVIHAIDGIIIFIIGWIIFSIPVWLASKFFSKNSSFLRALAATLVGIIVFDIINIIIGFFGFHLLGVILGFIGILFVFKSIFDVGWLGALGIAILGFVFAIILETILTVIGLSIFFI